MFVHCGRPIYYHIVSTFTFLVCSMQSAQLSLTFIPVFQMTAWGYFDVPTTSTSNEHSTSPSTSMMITSNRKGSLELLRVTQCQTKYIGSFWLHSEVMYPRMKCTNLVTRNTPCQCTVDGICALRVRTLKCIYVKMIGNISLTWQVLA